MYICGIRNRCRLMYFRPFSHHQFLRKMRSCEILRWRKTDVSNFCVYSIQQTPMWCIYAVSETEQIDVFSTVLPSLVFEKNAFMWNTPLEKNRCFKFLRSVFDSTDTDVMYICGIRNRTDWCIFDRSPITSFEKNAFMWNTPLEKNRCFKFLSSIQQTPMCCIRFNREIDVFSTVLPSLVFEGKMYICSVGEKTMFQISRFEPEQIDVLFCEKTVLPSLVFEKNAFMWNTPLEKTDVSNFCQVYSI